MTVFSEYFDDYERNNYRIIPGLAEYYTTPSAENARRLLRSLGLPLPYAALNDPLAASRSDVLKSAPEPAGPVEYDDYEPLSDSDEESIYYGVGRSRRARARARAHYREYKRKRALARSQPPPQYEILASKDLFDTHGLISIIYEFIPSYPSRGIFLRLYDAHPDLPVGLANELYWLCEKAMCASEVIARVEKRFLNIAEQLAGLALSGSPAPSVAETDMHLHAEVGRWYSKPTLEIVLDGVFRDVALPRSNRIRSDAARNRAVNDTDVARSLTFCAYLQLVITDWDTVRIRADAEAQHSSGVHVTDIRFLFGDFQSQDVPGVNKFIADWISHIRRETAYLSHLPPTAIGTRNITVADVPSLADTPFANVTLTPSGLSIKLPDRPNVTCRVMSRAIRRGTFVQYGRKRRGRPTREVSPDMSLAERYRREFFTSNPKNWLRVMFREYGYERAPTPESEVFIETIAVVNAFRDALRAEVALARGAVYITMNPLALVYYQARADRAAGASKKSNGLMIHPAGPENLSIRYYAPSLPATRAAGI